MSQNKIKVHIQPQIDRPAAIRHNALVIAAHMACRGCGKTMRRGTQCRNCGAWCR